MQNQEIYKKVGIINVMKKLNLKEIYSINNITYVRCPFCSSNNGSMILNTLNNSYICKSCEERGYAIGLYAKLKHITNKKAFLDLINSKLDETNKQKNIFLVNTKKNVDEINSVYQDFLNLLNLSEKHKRYLNLNGFDDNCITEIGFKTIPLNEEYKIQICRTLMERGHDLKGIPGFYQNKNFKWTFVSHEGFFVPIENNCKIIGLRIHLDKIYNTHTTDIWFSSSKKYNGTMMNNNIMVLYPKNKSLRMYNNNAKNDIIIVSEMLLAYKVYTQIKNKIVFGIPNVISNSELSVISSIQDINKIQLILERHSILHNSESILSSLEKIFNRSIIDVSCAVKDLEIPKDIIKDDEDEIIINTA